MDEEPDDGDWRPTQLLRRRPDMARMALAGSGTAAPSGARSPGGLGPGDRIFHRKFGYGVVRAADGGKLSIAFDKAGDKMVMESFVEKA
jgi:DNA helicase-2/ATP-dependent DNA helicase PcrA